MLLDIESVLGNLLFDVGLFLGRVVCILRKRASAVDLRRWCLDWNIEVGPEAGSLRALAQQCRHLLFKLFKPSSRKRRFPKSRSGSASRLELILQLGELVGET